MRFETSAARWLLSLAALLLAAVAWAGCAPQAPPKTGEADKGATDEDTAETEADKQAEGDHERPENVVLLGASDELTAGIPGAGPLTMEQIQAWLDDQRNRLELEIELPLGLDAGRSLVKGLEDNPLTRAKIELGRQLYFDPRLSADETVSCASCHDPDEGFTRHTQFGVGIGAQTGNRNSPVAYNRIFSNEQFWDGRADSLEDQAKGPIANPIEMGNTHEACEQCVEGIEGYRVQFERIFPDGVTIDNIAKAIASFERVLVTEAAPFDYHERVRALEKAIGPDLDDLDFLKEDNPELYEEYMSAKAAADKHPMSESAKRGRELFFGQKGGCTACHVGPNLSDEKYHNLGVGMDKEKPDLGRFAVSGEEKDKGAFKTPTIRNVELSAPYMHDGSQQTLEEVVEWYNKGGHPNDWLDKDVRKLDLTDQDKQDLVNFMKACTSDFPAVERERLPQ